MTDKRSTLPKKVTSYGRCSLAIIHWYGIVNPLLQLNVSNLMRVPVDD